MMRLPTISELKAGVIAPQEITEKDLPRLSEQEFRFVQEYLIDGNVKNAAIRAGYSPLSAHGTGYNVRKRPHVAAHIDWHRAQTRERYSTAKDAIARELAKLAFSSVGDFVSVTDDGQPVYDFSEMTPEQWAAISELTVEEFKDGPGKGARDVRKVKVKQHPKLEALKALATLLGHNEPEKIDLRSASVVATINPGMSPQEAAEVYAKIRG